MARYTGPKNRICRIFGEPILGSGKSLAKNSNPPGQHGPTRKRKTASEYAIQLKEKQKAKHIYGLLERQFRNLFEKAARRKGVTGENLLKYLESRLDNVVYRMGFGRTRRQARQLVSHCHVTVNGAVVNIPSFHVRAGDVVAIRPKSQQLSVVHENLSRGRKSVRWIEVDRKMLTGKFIELPNRDEIPENIKEHLIVELYSK